MTRKAFLLYIFFLASQLHTNAQTWQWAKSCPSNVGSSYGDGTAVCTDLNGNIFITGTYAGTLIAGNYTLITASGNSYLIKYDAGGNVLWARASVGTGASGDWPYSVCTDNVGNAYITGFFSEPTITFGTYTLTNNGNCNVFLVKYDPNGNVIWARQAVNTNSACAYSVSSDSNNNTYISGLFYDPTITFGTYTLTKTCYCAMFLVKYDSNGNVVWAKTPLGNAVENQQFGVSVSAEANGNTFVTGAFSYQTMIFGTYTLTNAGSENIFIAKYDSGGNVLWAKSVPGPVQDMANSVCADGNGNAYITGQITSPSLVFGNFTLTNTVSNQNMFLAKYDSNGNALWARESVGTYASGLSVGSNSCGAFITGYLSDTTALGNFTLSPGGSPYPTFIAQYDANGNVIFAQALGSAGDDWLAVGLDRFSNAYLTGDFDVSTFVIGTNTLMLTGYEDTFLAKLSYTNCQAPEGMNEFSIHNKDIRLFPNPNLGQFNIQIGEEIENGEVIISNSLSQKVYSQTVTRGENEINLKKFGSGLYYYSLTQNNQTIRSGKISIE